MNRLEETEAAAISSSFYKNVFLLTQVQPPSLLFWQHFRKDMFDRPNTAGFLYVSHYLSIIYDANLFQRMVRWPVLCKRDETEYRVQIQKFFCILSLDNPVTNFPAIMMSHLIHSGGIRFLIIMWKLSQLALEAYIRRKFQEELLHVPSTSLLDNLTITYFNNVIAKRRNVIVETHEETNEILEIANDFLNNEIEVSNIYKCEIFDRKANLKRLVSNISSQRLIQERLMNVEDSNIIDLWKAEISKNIQYICRKNEELSKLEESCSHVSKLILRINLNAGVLDANKFPKINCDYSLCLTFGIYKNNSITFSGLLSLFHMTIIQMQGLINAANFSDLSRYLLHIQNACKNVKSLQTLFNAMNMRIGSALGDEQRVSRENKNVSIDLDTNSRLIENYNILLQSPKLNFNFDQCLEENNLFYERLSFPIEDKHKDLFKRHRRKYRPSFKLNTAFLDFSSSWNNMSGWLSPRAHFTKCEQVSHNGKPLSPLYSRLLHHSKLKRSRDNIYNLNSSYERLNVTPKKRRSRLEQPAKNSLNERVRNLF